MSRRIGNAISRKISHGSKSSLQNLDIPATGTLLSFPLTSMNKAHALLGSSELLVSIPRRGCMLVTARDSDISVLETFTYFHNQAWNDDSFGNAPIINQFFVVQDGQLVGALPLRE